MTDLTLVIGDIEAARLVCDQLRTSGANLVHLLEPTDRELTNLTDQTWAAVAIVVRSDEHALRYALLVEHLQPGVRLVVTVFDRTLARRLAEVIPHCSVSSPADVSAPVIAAQCMGQADLWVGAHQRVSESGKALRIDPAPPSRVRGLLATVRRWLIPHWYGGREGMVVTGLVGLLGIVVLDWCISVFTLHEPPIKALYAATRIVATVGPANVTEHTPQWYLALSAVMMLVAIGFTGTFVAGLVEWLVNANTAGLVGRRRVPDRDHVVISGLGQVGMRVSLLLRELGVDSVVLERRSDAPNLTLARALHVPVIVGDARDRSVLRRAGLPRARALAALGSADIDNIAVAVSASAVAANVPVVLRAGEDPVVSESQSLFRIGQVCDVSALSAAWVSAALAGPAPDLVLPRGDTLWAYAPEGAWSSIPHPSRCKCTPTSDGTST